MTLRKAMKNVALAVKKQNAVHGRPSINQTKAAKRKAGEVEGRRAVNQVPAKVVEKAAESRNGPSISDQLRETAHANWSSQGEGNFSLLVSSVPPWLPVCRERCASF